MKFVSLVLLSAVIATADMAREPFEINDFDSNDKCNNQDLAVLNHCAKEVLKKLDQCGPDDLACECCALQSLKHVCYELCSDSFSSNFLNVLYEDCEPFKEVNACSFQFKEKDYASAIGSKKDKKTKNSVLKVDGSKIVSGNRSVSQGSTTSKVPFITKGKYQTDAQKNRSRDSTPPGLQVKDDSRVSPDGKFLQGSTYNHTNASNTTVSKQDLSSSVRLLPKVLALMLGTLVSTIVV
ncbi:hypothetical protein LJB42_001781 [Komagataella kurtzmanii]|nr:hypothetical protein LJB42_001781 [Komagataella kurtzmanii]